MRIPNKINRKRNFQKEAVTKITKNDTSKTVQ